jgi:hypothetical protein
MSDKITDTELKLAERINSLSDAAARPVVGGGGLLSAAANFLMSRVSRGMMAAALTVFIAYHGWEAFNGSLQAMSKLQQKRAEVGQTVAEAVSLNAQIGNDSAALARMKAELEKLQQEERAIRAEADAQNTIIGDNTLKSHTLRAEIDKTKAESQGAQIEANAQTQIIDGMPAKVAQKKAEVETLEEQVKAQVAKQKSDVEAAKLYVVRGNRLCRSGFGC